MSDPVMESLEIYRKIFSQEEDSQKAATSDTKPAVGSPKGCKYGKKHRRVPKLDLSKASSQLYKALSKIESSMFHLDLFI